MSTTGLSGKDDRVSARAWYALFVLILLYVVSMIDRTIISMLIGSIKLDLGLDDFQASLLMGTAFGICYVLLATPYGWAADRFPRPFVLAFGLAFWSLACMSCGLAGTFMGLFVSRMAVGAGEASMTPTAYPLIGELFRGRHLPRAMAIFHLAGTLGASLAMLIGGLVAGLAAQTGGISLPFVGELRPWQLAFVAVGLPGLPLVLLALTLPEPRRDAAQSAANQADAPSITPYVMRHRRLIFCHYLGFALAVMLAYGKSFWLPEYFVRTFGWNIAYAGSILAAVNLISAFVGQFLAVRVMDVLTRRGYCDAAVRGFIYTTIFGIFASVLAFATGNPWLSIIGVFFSHVATMPGLTYGSSSLQMIAPEALRGRLAGSFVTLVSLLGLGAGPALIGAVSTYVMGGPGQLGYAIMFVVVGSQLAVIVLLTLALAPFRKALAEVKVA